MRQMQEGIVKIDGCWVDDFTRGERKKRKKEEFDAVNQVRIVFGDLKH